MSSELQGVDNWLKSKGWATVVHAMGCDRESGSVDVLSLVDIDTIHLIIYIAFATAWTLVVDAAFIIRHVAKAQTDVVEMDVLDFTLFSTDETAVLRHGDEILRGPARRQIPRRR